jgi:hypothetical protein
VLRGTRYIWLRNPDNLSERQRMTLEKALFAVVIGTVRCRLR